MPNNTEGSHGLKKTRGAEVGVLVENLRLCLSLGRMRGRRDTKKKEVKVCGGDLGEGASSTVEA